jgi:hypothetical protein
VVVMVPVPIMPPRSDVPTARVGSSMNAVGMDEGMGGR